MTELPCRVSADLRAYQLREDRAPDEICDRCGASLFGDKRNPKWQPSDEGWLICPCGNALCEDCCGLIREAEDDSGFRKWLGWETTHNEGFCSPGCMAEQLKTERAKVGALRLAMRDDVR